MELSKEQKESIARRLRNIVKDYDNTKKEIDNDLSRLQQVVDNLPQTISEIDEEFERQTSITKKDVTFLIFASLLQEGRQYLSSLLKTRLSDQESAKKTPFHKEEHS